MSAKRQASQEVLWVVLGDQCDLTLLATFGREPKRKRPKLMCFLPFGLKGTGEVVCGMCGKAGGRVSDLGRLPVLANSPPETLSHSSHVQTCVSSLGKKLDPRGWQGSEWLYCGAHAVSLLSVWA